MPQSLRAHLKPIIAELSKEANKCRDREIKERYFLIKRVIESTKSVESVCDKIGSSPDVFYRWGKILKRTRSLTALQSKSRKPKRSPKQTPKEVERRILSLRKADPSHGPERISFYLKKHFNLLCPQSTVYAVLKRNGLITEEHKKERVKKHLKRYRRPFPGYLQMDIKYVPYLIEGKQYYQFNAVDHHSSWRLTRVYPDKTHESLIEFLFELEHECPFFIVQIQTDNGTEFTDRYRVGGLGIPTGLHPLDLWCRQNAIEHKCIPIGQKELNGKVENTHKYDDREFYSQYSFKNLSQLQRTMIGYNERWNTLRHTKTLDWKTPCEVINEAGVRAMVYLNLFTKKYKPNSIIEMDANGNTHLTIEEHGEKKRPNIGPKKQTAVNRYLQWLEWEEKKSRYKSLIPLPFMFPNFSGGRWGPN